MFHVKPSLRRAIDAKCKSCTYDPLSGLGTWRQQVMACTIENCALWPVRPLSKPSKPSSGAPQPEALRRWREAQG